MRFNVHRTAAYAVRSTVRTPVYRNSGKSPKKFEEVTYDTDTVFAAAAAAYVDNKGEYIKVEYDGGYNGHDGGDNGDNADGNDVVVRVANRTIMMQYLNGEATLTDEHRAMGGDIRLHFQGLMMTSILADKPMNDFDQSAFDLASGDTIPKNKIGLIAYLPVSFHRDQKRFEVQDRLRCAVDEMLGKLGETVAITVDVVRVSYSQQWSTYYITAITDSNHAVRFSLKTINPDTPLVDSRIKITGKVKTKEDNCTKLTHVKILEEVLVEV